ncbi:hypothetical protein [Desulfosporosinus sp. BICA1-9]|uniref:hypothetical protein n=1 Tax=Desulfosporosinus sp. BICA1-9 TaxID=1531958 RepID=UPI00054B21D2|nr:hypothetical protein [Desulfosporosinus sp. BICA1-9]KJS48806.1 MAG: hypothetical protein VR66_11980 [Peptococcaceae bacterium BRH_c23]KJS77800.1 MAG: hypothetical protein JL57_32920 [Desulfosporosinus sp. BICA1-9]HBW34764.1 hypothetical protein [Desulfosporosinus sp.]
MATTKLEFLDGFEQRMKLVAAIDSIINRGNRKMEFERLFEPGQLDNIILSVLVFIMERTLTEDEDCTMESIANFVAQILPDYSLNLTSDIHRKLTEYIIKDILQNGGEARYYPVMKYGQGMEQLRIRLIDDKLIDDQRGYVLNYQLTDQGYDLLFRTKEVEQEISFTIEELKLRELIKRKNYKKAIGQSANLVQMIRQKKNDIRQFVQKVRENIYDVNIEEFERLVSSTYTLLEEEYGMMNEIRGMIVLSEERLKEEENTRGALDEQMTKARSEIAVIRRNINLTIGEQKELILERLSLSRIYKETIADSFALSRARYYDLEQVILKPLEQCEENKVPYLWQLLNPLFKPNPDRTLNLLTLFERQARLKQEEEGSQSIVVEELGEDKELLRISKLNDSNIEFIRSLLEFAHRKRESFRFSEFFQDLETQQNIFKELTIDDLIFKTMLKLYDLQVIDIKKWKTQQEDVVANATGELDVSYCLYRIMQYTQPDLFGIKKLEISKPDEHLFAQEIEAQIGDGKFSRRIAISDFRIEVSFE